MKHNLKTLFAIAIGENKTDNVANYTNQFIKELQQLKQNAIETNTEYSRERLEVINEILGENQHES